MLVQLHWQHRTDFGRTEFVAQGEFDSVEGVDAWATEIIRRRREECPEGYGPMICTEDSSYFVRAAAPAVVGG